MTRYRGLVLLGFALFSLDTRSYFYTHLCLPFPFPESVEALRGEATQRYVSNRLSKKGWEGVGRGGKRCSDHVFFGMVFMYLFLFFLFS